jgi:hypothetical protein
MNWAAWKQVLVLHGNNYLMRQPTIYFEHVLLLPLKSKSFFLCRVWNQFSSSTVATSIGKDGWHEAAKMAVGRHFQVLISRAEMRYYEISKEMSSLYFGLAVFCLFEARVPEFDIQTAPPFSVCTVHWTVRQIPGF